ncbi:MAG: hypothetical protein K2N48_00560 [Muribaculaceae bacterium]|nr:hypothetical protein [Muribaculaceae bacterium]
MHSKFIIPIIFVFLTFSCATENGRRLRDADSVMEEHPDSAMSILMDIDRNALKDSDLPYYALLYTQAQVKTNVPLDSDSLISIAYAKYGADTRGDRGIRSNFYTGEVFFNQEKYREAMRYYLTAYEESKRLRNDYWRAKAAERISDLFFFAYNYDEAEKYAMEASDLFNNVGRQRNHRYSLAQLANILINNGDPDRAYTLLDSLETLILKQDPVDTLFLNYIKFPLVDAMTQTGRIEDSELNGFDFSVANISDRVILDAAILQSQVYEVVHKPDNVKDMLDSVGSLAHSVEDKVHILYARYENAKSIGDLRLAISLVDSMLFYQNKMADEILQESVTGAQRDFYNEMSLRHESKSYILKCMLYCAIGIFLVLIAVGIVFFHLKLKVRKAESQAQLEAFLSLKSFSDKVSREKTTLQRLVSDIENRNEAMSTQIQVLQSTNDQLVSSHNEIVEKLFKEKWTTLDTLCDQYFSLNNSELNAKDLISNMEKELKKIVSKKGLADIVNSVDTYMGGIITDLRIQCPFLKDADVNFLALLYAGFSVRAVCMFTGIKYPNFYVKKSRLVKRIQASDAPDKSHFLEKLK